MTTNLLSVIEQQQKALKELLSVPNDDSPESVARCILSHTRARKAIAAGKQALEQAQGEAVAWMHLEMGTCFSAAHWAVKNSKDPLAKEFVPLYLAQSTIEKCTDEKMCTACYSGQGTCENASPKIGGV